MVSRRHFLILAGSTGAIAITAANVPGLLASADPDGDRLPSVRYGEESCARCGMLIDDVRFAAAWVSPSAEVHFDDIGCMVTEAAERPAPADAQFYVSTYEAGQWVKAEHATYVLSPKIRTPMAYGVAAAPTRADAERIVHGLEGTAEDWHTLPSHLEQEGH